MNTIKGYNTVRNRNILILYIGRGEFVNAGFDTACHDGSRLGAEQ